MYYRCDGQPVQSFGGQGCCGGGYQNMMPMPAPVAYPGFGGGGCCWIILIIAFILFFCFICGGARGFGDGGCC